MSTNERLQSRQVSLREAIGIARSLGCSVEPCHRNGEIEFAHPRYFRRVRVNARRKDTPRVVMTMLRVLAGDAAAEAEANEPQVGAHPLLRKTGQVAPAFRLDQHDKRDR